MNMMTLCPYCEKETQVDIVKELEKIDVRGEIIEVESEFCRCRDCEEEFENTDSPDAIDLAYRSYRKRRSMLQPEEIRNWRKQHGFTQRELSLILGWGGATLSRYENGALQDEAQEKLLRLAMEPHNLLSLIEDSPNALSDEKRKRIVEELKTIERESCSFEMMFEEHFSFGEADEYSGFQKLSLEKLFNTILYFCMDGGVLKTKLNKLLFYADFKHFKEYAAPITGARYVHLQYGPVPDNYEFFIAELIREKELDAQEEFFNDYSGVNHLSVKKPELTIFSEAELKILAEVKETFKSYTSRKIKDFSHKEKAYLETNDRELISYKYAADLLI